MVLKITQFVLSNKDKISYLKTDRKYNYLKIHNSKFPRCYIYFSPQKYMCFAFPFRYSEKDNVFYCESLKLDSEVISNALSLIDQSSSKTLIDLYNLIGDDSEIYNDTVYKLVERLALFEYGYVRFDDDSKHESGLIHPRMHLDLNYSQQVSFKLGLYKIPNQQEYEDIFNKSAKCAFVIKNKKGFYLKFNKNNKIVSKRSKNK
ncbi:MAG: hypothetical protein ACI31F_05795 [Muribaculaceae bacterium]